MFGKINGQLGREQEDSIGSSALDLPYSDPLPSGGDWVGLSLKNLLHILT